MAGLSRSDSLGHGDWSPIQNKGLEISAPLHVSDNAPPRRINLKSPNPFDVQRTNGSTLPERPSTSGGSSASRRLLTDRRSKDDLHFNPLAANRVDSFGSPPVLSSFPLPASRPTPEVTPPSSPQAPSTREASPEPLIADLVEHESSGPLIADLIEEVAEMNARSLGIGMALGSPSQIDNPAVPWQVPTVHHETSITADTMSNSVPKSKNSKWKRFFGVKRAASPSTFYQVQQDAARGNSSTDGSQALASTANQRATKPANKRANTAPVYNTHKGGLKDKNGRALTGPPDAFVEEAPMLRVDIPTITMDRYSVMFGSVLQKGSSESQQSGLLARRQATLDKLKTVNEAIATKVCVSLHIQRCHRD